MLDTLDLYDALSKGTENLFVEGRPCCKEGSTPHSHAASAGECTRKQVLDFVSPEEITLKNKKSFSIGVLLEQHVINTLAASEAFSLYKGFSYRKVFNNVFDNNPFEIVARPDLIIDGRPIEIKAVGERTYKKFCSLCPPEKYTKQLMIYINILEAPEGFFIVINRVSGEYFISRITAKKTEEEFSKILERLSIVELALRINKIPKKPYKNSKNEECKYCRHFKRCWK